MMLRISLSLYINKGGGVIPLYEYQCLDCANCDERIAGLDEYTALCIRCGGVMLRQDEDVFRAYFEGDNLMHQPGASL